MCTLRQSHVLAAAVAPALATSPTRTPGPKAQGVEPDAQQTLSSGCFGCTGRILKTRNEEPRTQHELFGGVASAAGRYPAPQEEWLLERAEDEFGTSEVLSHLGHGTIPFWRIVTSGDCHETVALWQ